jgi:3-phenylpropionate/cinnamic acid dioxygenase small subunit
MAETFEELILARMEKETPKFPALRELRTLLTKSQRAIKTIPAKKSYLAFIKNEIEKREYLRNEARLKGREAFEKFKKGDRSSLDTARHYWGLTGWYSVQVKYCWKPLQSYWLAELAIESGYEFIDYDADTGREIYFSVQEKKYFEVDGEGRVIYTSDELELTETVSIETGGHEDIEVEVTARTRISNLNKKIYEELQKTVQTQLNIFFKNYKGEGEESYFKQIRSNALKIGTETRIRPVTTKKYPIAEVLIEKVGERRGRYPTYRQEPEGTETPGKVSAYIIDLKAPTASPTPVMVKAPFKSTKKEEEVPKEIVEKKRKELREVI